MQPHPKRWMQMPRGDVIAFGSGGHITPIGRSVEIESSSHVAHVAVVERVLMDGDVALIDSTAIGRPGVKRSFLSERMPQHAGDSWWLPLSDAVRNSLHIERFRTFLDDQRSKGYDLAQAIAPINASEVTPIDLCRFAIYAQQCYQLKEGSALPCGYNTVVVSLG